MNIDPKLLEKIEKVLKLAEKSDSKHEAETAMLIIQKELAKHKMSLSDIKGVIVDDDEITANILIDSTKHLRRYKPQIAAVLKEYFFCEVLQNKTGGYATGHKGFLTIIGKQKDIYVFIKVLLFIYPIFERERKREYKAFKRIKKNRNSVFGLFQEPEFRSKFKKVTRYQFNASFLQGFCEGLYRKFEEQKKQMCDEFFYTRTDLVSKNNTNPYALMLKREMDRVEEWIQKHIPHVLESQDRMDGIVCAEALESGFKIGHNLNINAIEKTREKLGKQLRRSK